MPSTDSKTGVDLEHLTGLTAVPAKEELIPQFIRVLSTCFPQVTLENEVIESRFKRDHYGHFSVEPWSSHIWILVARDDAESQREPLSWVFALPRVYLHRTAGGDIRKEIVWNLYSTLTLPQYRGRGYCLRLLQLLHYCLGDATHLPPFPPAWGAPPPVIAPGAKRPATLPIGIASRIQTDVIQHLCESATLGGAVGTGFRFTPEYNEYMEVKVSALQDHNISPTSTWTSSWVPRSALAEVERIAGSAERQALAAGTFGGGNVLIPYSGHPGALDYRLHVTRCYYHGRPEYLTESTVGLRLRSAESGVEHFCVVLPNKSKGLLMVTFMSPDFPAGAIPLLLARLREVSIDNQCHTIRIYGLYPELSMTKALIEAGGQMLNATTIDGTDRIGLVWYGPPAERDEVSWRNIQHFCY